jgi:Golgi apyrase
MALQLTSQVELSRLQMQCFKGAWISNVLHEGIGIPRLVDHGGNDTLTGGNVGDTNAEAERRARQKGLLEAKRKHHFQSMDEIGETAISWTLGKMVIEASKAVQPRSAALEAAWTSRLPSLGLGHVEQRLNAMGIETIWAYGFFALFLVLCIFNSVRRKLRWSCTSLSSPRRGRKPSIPRDVPLSASTGWTWPWKAEEYTSVEDGLDFAAAKSMSKGKTGTWRLWSRRLAKTLKRASFAHTDQPRRTQRHASMPLTTTSRASSTPWSSQPPSPRTGSGFFFTPALGIPGGTPSESSSPSPGGAVTTSPPRTRGGRPSPRTRTNSHSGHQAAKLGVPDSMGWNDPPMALLAHEDGGTLTPTAQRGYEHNISRQSSRVNLSELGLAQRNASRAATPHGFHEPL